MAKKKDNTEALRIAYVMVAEELGLEGMSEELQVSTIVKESNETMTKICQGTDFIKIEMYNQVKEDYPELGMPQPVWLELVNLRRLKLYTDIPDKVIKRITDSYSGAKNVTALRESLIGNLINDQPLKVSTAESAKALSYEQDTELDEKFTEYLNDSAAMRHRLDTVLWPNLRKYGDAFCYLTKRPYNDFKFLLDMWHYREGGYPSEKTPPRHWRAVAGFNYVYRLMSTYDMLGIDALCKRFGIHVHVDNHVHPSLFNWGPLGELFGLYTMYKIKPEFQDEYELKYNIKPWHHLIEADNHCFGYVWDTRVIEFSKENFTVPEKHRDYEYQDSCQLLIPTLDNIEEAKRYIPALLRTDA